MIKNYLEFINEKLEFILESEVVYSDKFRLALNKIDSEISKSLLSIENKDLDVRSNYLDIILDNNDSISFIPDSRAQRILDEENKKVSFIGRNGGWLTYNKEVTGELKNKILFDELGFTPPENGEIIKPENGEVGEIVKKVTSEESGKTYAWVKFTSTELVINVDKLRSVDDRLKRVWSTNRQQVRVGRAIRSLLTSADINFTDSDIEIFVNQYKATIDKFNDKFSYFEEVKGDDIAYWYDNSNYLKCQGTLGSSCMSNVDSEFFDIYVLNPDVCSLIILKSEDDYSKIIGRALLWKIRDGKRFMDRVYSLYDSDVQLFRDWARENGWYYKLSNSSVASSYAISPKGERESLNLTVDIRSGEYDKYPYLDTFKFWDPRGTLSVNDGPYILEETDGGNMATSCSYCDDYGSRECYHCDGNGSLYCDECNGSGRDEDDKVCDECNGRGDLECNVCGGNGSYPCPECQ
jgi:hypothetical protein